MESQLRPGLGEQVGQQRRTGPGRPGVVAVEDDDQVAGEPVSRRVTMRPVRSARAATAWSSVLCRWSWSPARSSASSGTTSCSRCRASWSGCWACGSHFTQSQLRSPPVTTATRTSSGACSTDSWSSSDWASPRVRGRGPSRLTTPAPRRSSQAAWPSTLSWARTSSAAAYWDRVSVSAVGSFWTGRCSPCAEGAAPVPTRRCRKSGSPGRRSHTRRRRVAMAHSRSGCGWCQASAARCAALSRSACLRTPARYSAYRSRCRYWLRRRLPLSCMRTPMVMPTDTTTKAMPSRIIHALP